MPDALRLVSASVELRARVPLHHGQVEGPEVSQRTVLPLTGPGLRQEGTFRLRPKDEVKRQEK